MTTNECKGIKVLENHGMNVKQACRECLQSDRLNGNCVALNRVSVMKSRLHSAISIHK